MTRKIISLCLIAAMLLTMMPLSAFASGDATPYLEDTLPTDWTNQHKDFTITAKDGVTAMSVNGTAVEMIGGSIGGGVISEGGKPYVKYKFLGYDNENPDVMHIGAFIGNIKSGKGHGSGLFTFKYDKTNWAPYDLVFEEELTTTEYGLQDFFFMGYSAADRDAYKITTAQIAKAKAITLETSESGAMLDLSTGVVAVTWYTSVAEIDATQVEIPILRFALIKKGNGAFTANTLTQPLTTELTSNVYTAGLFDKTVTSSNQIDDSVAGIVYTTGNNNIDYVVEASDGTRYGCAPSVPGTLKFEGNTANADAFKVEVTVNGTPYTKTYNVKYDDVKPTIEVKPEQSADSVQKVTYNVTAEDDKSGVKAICVNGTWHDGNSYTVDVEESGKHTFEFKAIDNAGNESDVVTRTVTIDNEGPELNVTGNPADWTKEDVVLTVSTEAGATVTVDGKALTDTTFTATKNDTYTFVATDKAGNKTTKAVEVTKIDKTAPSVEVTGNAVDWTKENVVLTVDAKDSESGVATIKVDGKAIEGTTFTAKENGTYTFVVTDNVGNSDSKTVEVTKIDKTAPSIEITGNATDWTKENVILNVKATDNLSKDNEIEITLNDKPFTGETLEVEENGKYTFVATDKAGNKTTETVEVKMIDKVVPSIKVSGNEGEWTNEDVVITIDVTVGESGVKSIEVGDDVIEGNTFTVSKDGTYKVKVTSVAGNSVEKNVVVADRIDKIAPTLNVSEVPTKKVKEHTFTFEANDGDSGLEKVTVSKNGGAEEIVDGEYTVNEAGAYVFTAYDVAGNTTEVTRTIPEGVIDNEAPVIEIQNAPEGWLKEDCTINFTVSETATVVLYKNGEVVGEVAGTAVTITESASYYLVATDEAENVSEKAEFDVSIDKTAPEIIFGDVSDEWVLPEYEVELFVGENESGLESVTVNGEEIDVDSRSFTVNENKTYNVVAIDKAGNVAKNSITITNIDEDAPVISNISEAPSNWVKEYTLTFTVADAKSGVYSVRVNGEAVDKASPSFVITENEDYEIEVEDNLGNTAKKTITIDYIDEEAPVVEEPEVPSNKCHDFILEIVATDSQSGVEKVTVDGNEATFNGDVWEYFIEDNGEYAIKAVDSVGRESEAVKVTVGCIDNERPVITISGYEDAWTNEDIVLTIEVNKEIKTLTVSKDNGEEKVVNGDTYSVTENGTYKFTATDELENVGTKTITITKIDKDNPTIEVSGKPEGYVNEPYNVTVYATDVTSAVTVTVSKDNGEPIVVSGTTYPIAGEGEYTFVATDEAGNTDPFVLKADNLDFDAPVFAEPEYSKDWAKEVTVKVAATDNVTENVTITERGNIRGAGRCGRSWRCGSA